MDNDIQYLKKIIPAYQKMVKMAEKYGKEDERKQFQYVLDQLKGNLENLKKKQTS